MNWSDIVTKVREVVIGSDNGTDSANKLPDILGWIEKGRQAYENGTVLATEILDAAKYFSEQYEALKSVDYKKFVDQVVKGHGENAYSGILASLTTDELLELHRSSVDQLRVASNKKLRELEVIRSLIELPVKLKSIIAIFV